MVPEDDEKTVIDSNWEEEPSTTIAQGEIAEQIRAMGADVRHKIITNVTATGAGTLEEPTVDDRRSSDGLGLMASEVPHARLVITSGKDNGNELVLEPGKTYTVGRALDNDLVLTDIAVSRKHFDLRYSDGGWMIVDRGSGNGTLVNGNLEDHPFTLAHGDTVEIGNTIFRFDQPSAATRPAPTVELSLDQSIDHPIDRPLTRSLSDSVLGDEEEASTIAGKPVRTEEVPTPAQLPPPVRARPKTMPPPVRPRPPSVAPPLPANARSAAPQLGMNGPVPANLPVVDTAPLRSRSPSSVGNLGNAGNGMGNGLGNMGGNVGGNVGGNAGGPAMLVDQRGPSRPMQVALPAQSAPMPAMFGYPHAGDLPPQHAPSLPPLVVPNLPGRDATSTALVPPAPYGAHAAVAQPYRAAMLSRRAKLVLGGAALTLFAAIATVAIIKGTSNGRADAAATGPAPEGDTSETKRPAATVSPITEALQGGDPGRVAKVDETKPVPETKTETKTETKPETQAETKTEPETNAAVATASEVAAQKIEAVEAKPEERTEPETSTVAAAATQKAPVDETARAVTKKDPPKTETTRVVAKKDPPKTETAPKKEPAKRAGDTGNVRTKADRLYRDKSFSAAAKVLRDAAANLSGEEASSLKSLAGTYDAFGKAFNLGMAPNTPAKQAWDALTRASGYDRSLGNAFSTEINSRLGQIAPKAAAAFMAAREYVKAKKAVSLAESTGNRNSTTDGVRQSLETAAGQLYRQAEAEMAKDPAAAKAKLKTIQGMVDSKSQWYQRAGKLLSGSR